jgi:hypothetical protein
MRLLALPVLFVAVGCGSDGTKKPMLLDSKVFLDAGPDAAPTCGIKTMFGGLTLGNTATPVMSDWYDMPTMGPNSGKVVMSIGARLPDSTATEIDLFIMEYVKPAIGFKLNMAVPFDPNPAQNPATAYAYIFSDLDSTGMMYNNFYFASTGSITVSSAVESDGGLTTGTMAAANFREVDEMTNADIAGGCTSMFAGLSFNLKQMAANPFTKTDAQIQVEAGGVTSEQMRNVAARIQRFHAERELIEQQ